MARNAIAFYLNDRLIELDTLKPDATLLDYLRLEARLRGTKEGCAEGDCGACTVLVGRLLNGDLRYETVNSCIRFLGSLHGCHVVTVEHLQGPDGALHPVQKAMVQAHASQCGFCTPGFVMSAYALWLGNSNPTTAEIETALQGNLCRCTGYAPIVRAVSQACATRSEDRLKAGRDEIKRKLSALVSSKRIDIGAGRERLVLPASVDDLAAFLVEEPDATIVAGATDVGLWVTKFMREIAPVVFIAHLEALHAVDVADAEIAIGACVTYSEARALIANHYPEFQELWHRVGGEQIRNMGTIGGNVANGSPIGDTPPALIALGAQVYLRHGDDRRSVAVEDFFIDYGRQDRASGEFIERITIPRRRDTDKLAAYKVSKRREEDISSVCGAFRLRLDADGNVEDLVLAYGGMAATPKRATTVEKALIGRPWNERSLQDALASMADDFQPLTDWRASAEYRLLVAGNLVRRFLLETTEPASRVRLERAIA